MGIAHIASKFPLKKAMVLRDDCEIEFEGEDDNNESMSPLEDASDIEFAIDRETL